MIAKYLDISTGHVSKETAEWIEEQTTTRSFEGGVIAYMKGEYGWIVYVHEEVGDDVPLDLVEVLVYARKKKCIWIMFDADGEQIKQLPMFDW